MSPSDEARQFGFDWPGRNDGNPSDRVAHVQVQRVSSISRGKRGIFKVLEVKTPRDRLHLYISPTGLIRVFKKGKELHGA